MCAVWKAPATWSGMTRALAGRVVGEGGELLGGPGGDDLAGAVDVGRGEAVSLDGREDLLGVATDDGAHPGGSDGARGGHRRAALPDEDHGLLRGDDPGGRGGGDLADGVAGAGADPAEAVGRVLEEG